MLKARLQKLEKQLLIVESKTHFIAIYSGEAEVDARANYEQIHDTMIDDSDSVIYFTAFSARSKSMNALLGNS